MFMNFFGGLKPLSVAFCGHLDAIKAPSLQSHAQNQECGAHLCVGSSRGARGVCGYRASIFGFQTNEASEGPPRFGSFSETANPQSCWGLA